MTVSSVGSSSLAQQLRELQQAKFTAADANTDGALSLSEFQSIGQNVQGEGKNSPAAALTSQASSGQGFSSDTLSSLISLLQTLQSADTSTGAQGSRGDKMFAESDADGDGKVTTEELATAMAAKAPANRSADAPSADDMAARMVEQGDTDGDGSLSETEMSALRPKGGPGGPGGPGGAGGPPPAGAASTSESSASSGTEDTDPADLNEDGTVSAQELAQSLTSASTKLASDVSSTAADLMQKLLAQLTSAMAGESETSVSATA